MTNINGKAYAMNAITPMKWWDAWFLRVFFLLLRIPAVSADLVNLSFIHFARWVIVPRGRFPQPDSHQPKQRLRYSYLLFFSNFNGTWNQYIDAFADVLSRGLNAVWFGSHKFPGAVPVTPFKTYIAGVQFDTDYYYNAYPQASINDIKAAHRVQAALDRLRAESAGMSAEEFARAYAKFITAVQGDLGATGEAPVGT